LEIQLIRRWFDAWRWRGEFNRVCMKALAALRAVAAYLREFIST
jgi:hypothetical protein